MASKQTLVPAAASFDLMWAPMRLRVLVTGLELHVYWFTIEFPLEQHAV